ncbi:cystatin-like fold lipoprotein [Bacillus mojavensis]|uniref:cystatin-like fold lipoprotein n=1 Tax=Bacillus mojavensis TaxID=72360 RepID=UPI002DCD14A0|nr:cystatin-like fold lipoprotein [Bacillus mojavensis]MEC1708932.1 cystatin-like fold lipoprotein [Bacillus mojavensis]
MFKIKILFYYMQKNFSRELTPFKYYEKLGDKYEKMTGNPRNGENDHLGLSEKTPDYEEVKGKSDKIEE